MSVSSRRETLERARPRYQSANRADKGHILGEFVANTGYARKYAIWLLNQKGPPQRLKGSGRRRVYDQAVIDALAKVWRAMNCICSKRMVPFLPEFVRVLERDNHLRVSPDVRARLLGVSASTADRLLAPLRLPRGVSTTTPGQLLKKQIAVRTHNDWNDTRPGFFEIDLVAHCGSHGYGSYLYTLVLTDIATGWTVLRALPNRTAQVVVAAIERVRASLPFGMLGLDSDNGSEFINEDLAGYCRRHEIVFTRSRPYKKNDQAHVEERNGSVVRRLVGYDRFAGDCALEALDALYEVHGPYLNCFQPMMKLESKQRDCGHVTKRYQVARTPVDRVLQNKAVPAGRRRRLRLMYEALDPVVLLAQLRGLQERFLGHAWSADVPMVDEETQVSAEQIARVLSGPPSSPTSRRTRKPPVTGAPRNPFTDVWNEVALWLEEDPSLGTAKLLARLQAQYPGRFRSTQLGSLHKKVRAWRLARLSPCGVVGLPQPPADPPIVGGQSKAFALVWDQIRAMLVENPFLSSRKMLARLQQRNPGRFKDGQRRSLQRLLTRWRSTLPETVCRMATSRPLQDDSELCSSKILYEATGRR